MPEKEFNLLHEPWLLVMRPDGEIETVSLLKLFERAPEFRGLAGELPTQDVALLRLLLAILHAVFARWDLDGRALSLTSAGEARRRWKALWDRKAFPYEVIQNYLLSYEERFWLFHPQYPFYQVSLAEPVIDPEGVQIKPSERDAGFLIGDIAESDNKIRLFNGRMQKDSVPYDEAARWLLYANSFDIAPGGRPASSAINIKGYGLAWLNKLGLVWANGSNLFETLLLNFILATHEDVWDGSGAIWEQEFLYNAETLKQIVSPLPRSPAELLTLQSRRMQLIRNDDKKRVIKLLIWSGQLLDAKDLFLEHMTLWQKKSDGSYHPKMHDPSRQIWRDFSSIVSMSSGNARPGIITWIFWLQDAGILDIPCIQLNTAGVICKNNTTLTHVFTDSLRINLSFLHALGADWVDVIQGEIGITDRLVDQVGFLAQNLAKAAGDRDGGDARDAAREQAYFRLDMPFRQWLEGIDPQNTDMDDARTAWWKLARDIVRDLGRELVEQAGPRAFVGRMVKENNKERRYTAPEIYNRFMYYTSGRQVLEGGMKRGQ